MHEGPWKTRPAALPQLLKSFHEATGAPVSFRVRDVRLSDTSLFDSPFLYLTGTTDFALDKNERANLRQFLLKGGVLLAEAGDGRSTFDKAFRAEMARIFPDQPLAALPAGHYVFRQPVDVRHVKPRPALAAQKGNAPEVEPEIYGIELNGTPAVFDSPHDLSAGWEQARAVCRGLRTRRSHRSGS